MKRFVRRQEDVPYVKPPKPSEVVKAIEDAWKDIKGVDIRMKDGILVQCGNRYVTYKDKPSLRFADGKCFWTVFAYSCDSIPVTVENPIVIGPKISYPLAKCYILDMGEFLGHVDDIKELEAAAEELKRAYTKVQELLKSEACEAPSNVDNV